MKKIIKNIFFVFCLFLARVSSFLGVSTHRPVVLLYHSVGNNDSKYTVSERDFIKQMNFLKKNKKVVSLSELVEAVEKKEKTKNLVAVTIDDGYFDSVDFVARYNKELGFPPITVFLTTNLEQSDKLGGIKRPDKDDIVRTFNEESLIFEMHGHNHKPFREALGEGEESLKAEILDCQNKIFELTGYKSYFLAYPSGRQNEEIRNFIKNLGIKAGFGNNYGTISGNESMMSLPRVQVDKNTNFLLFKIRLSRAVDIAESIKNFFKKYGNRK